MLIPHVRRVEWPEPRPNSFATSIVGDDPKGCRVALLGIPDDTGVRLNHGQPGADKGPGAFRRALAKYGTAHPEGITWPRVFDAGDIQPAFELAETHRRVTEATEALLDLGLLPVAIGGGHDLTLPLARAVARRCDSIGGIYLDAHLDVREGEGSGMAFRRLVLDEGVNRLDVIGLDPLVNDHEHVRWFISHGGRIDAIEPDGEWPGTHLFFSVDLDAIDASQAPGVSARNPSGMSAEAARVWARAAGRCDRVRCFDIMELCPANDESERTARLAAAVFLSFLAGVSGRRMPNA
ncbi:MAG: formimidoylglutamase [Phycisphaerales bacterium]